MRREAGGEGRAEERVVLLACVRAEVPHTLPGDVAATCFICGCAVYHRPGALDDLPAGAKAACLPCAARYARDHDRPGWMATRGMTRGTLDEVSRYLHEYKR